MISHEEAIHRVLYAILLMNEGRLVIPAAIAARAGSRVPKIMIHRAEGHGSDIKVWIDAPEPEWRP